MNTGLQNVTLSIPKSDMNFFYELTRKMGWEVRPKQYVVEDAPPLYTMEEINARIDEAEAEIDDDKCMSSEVAHRKMKQYIDCL